MKKLIFLIFFSTSSFAYDWNIKVNPFTFLLGATNIEGNYGVSDKVSVGFGGLSWNAEILDIEFTATEYHLRADYWWNNTFEQGNYIGLQVSRINMELTSTINDTEFSGDIASTGYLVQFGHHWQWESFNIDLGTYFGVYDFKNPIELEDDNGNKEEENAPAFGAWGLEFFIGWAF